MSAASTAAPTAAPFAATAEAPFSVLKLTSSLLCVIRSIGVAMLSDFALKIAKNY